MIYPKAFSPVTGRERDLSFTIMLSEVARAPRHNPSPKSLQVFLDQWFSNFLDPRHPFLDSGRHSLD